MYRRLHPYRVFPLAGIALGAALVLPSVVNAQVGGLPGFEVIRGSDNPDAIPPVKAYESMVRGHLVGDDQRGADFLAYEVRLTRAGASELSAYAREGWRRLVRLQLDEARAICADSGRIAFKAELAERILSAKTREDALRMSLFEGAFEILDERNRERLRRYLEKVRSEITTSSYDIERSITESPDSLATMITRVCAHISN